MTPFDPASLGMTCHGGYSISPTGRGLTPKQFSAYMLIYEREFILPNPAPPPVSSVPPPPTPPPMADTPAPSFEAAAAGASDSVTLGGAKMVVQFTAENGHGGGEAEGDVGSVVAPAVASPPPPPSLSLPDGAKAPVVAAPAAAGATAVAAAAAPSLAGAREGLGALPSANGEGAEPGKEEGGGMEIEKEVAGRDENTRGSGGGEEQEKAASESAAPRGNGSASGAREEDEWEPPWMGVPRPSELVPSSVFQVCFLT